MTEHRIYTPDEARELVIETTKRGAKPSVCAHCGHPVYPDEIREVLAGKQRAIYEVIARAGALGISTEEICETVYADDLRGIPTWNSISVNVRIINQKIAPWGLVMRSTRGWGVSCYRLFSLEAPNES